MPGNATVIQKPKSVHIGQVFYVTFAGLLDRAHELGLESIDTEILKYPDYKDGTCAVVKATVVMTSGLRCVGHGDADESNCPKMVANALIRMAETRAKARALRDAVNVGDIAIEEFGPQDPHEMVPISPQELRTAREAGNTANRPSNDKETAEDRPEPKRLSISAVDARQKFKAKCEEIGIAVNTLQPDQINTLIRNVSAVEMVKAANVEMWDDATETINNLLEAFAAVGAECDRDTVEKFLAAANDVPNSAGIWQYTKEQWDNTALYVIQNVDPV
jgi:hypothetical protein